MKPHYKDIARQLIEENPGRKMNLIFGGGRDALGSPMDQVDKVKFGGGAEISCKRSDKENLVEKYLHQFSDDKEAHYVTNAGEMITLDYEDVDHVLGLFSNNHMSYNSLRDKSAEGEPSMSEMTKAAIKILNNKKNVNGYVLVVESGKIDQGHHQNHARLALEEMVEFDRAIQEAYEMTSDDTLIIVTADHAHALIFNGYPTRGNDIFGLANKPEVEPYETLVYATGPGYWMHLANSTNETFIPIINFTAKQRAEPTYMHTSMIPMTDAAHSGEDVGVFATGPGSNLIQGVFEQSFIPYVISFASCIGPVAHQNPACRGERYKSNASELTRNWLLLLTLNWLCLLYRQVL